MPRHLPDRFLSECTWFCARSNQNMWLHLGNDASKIGVVLSLPLLIVSSIRYLRQCKLTTLGQHTRFVDAPNLLSSFVLVLVRVNGNCVADLIGDARTRRS